MKPVTFYNADDFSKEELAYYKGDGKFKLGAKEYEEIDKGGENRYESIHNGALMDLTLKKKRREPKDFNNNAEYMLYDATLYEAICAIENGFGKSILG